VTALLALAASALPHGLPQSAGLLGHGWLETDSS